MDYTFECSFVTLLHVMTKIEALEANKPSNDNLPTEIIQEAKEVICPYLTDSIYAGTDSCVLLDKLKEADVRAIYTKGDPCPVVNYRRICMDVGTGGHKGQVLPHFKALGKVPLFM